MLPGSPYIRKAQDGKYHLFCGQCDRSVPKLTEVQRLITGQSIFTIMCGNCCNRNGSQRPICNLSDIETIAKFDAPTPSEVETMIRDVCTSLGIQVQKNADMQ